MPPEGSEIFHRRDRFVLVSAFISEGNMDEGKGFMITKGTVEVCLLHFRLEDVKKNSVSLITFSSILLLFGSVE